MKTIVVYYSMGGNTELVARKIAEKTGAETLRLVPVKAYPDKGFKKFFWGGRSAVMAETPELEPYTFDGASYERIVFGFPVWASTVTPPIRTFIKDNAEAIKGKSFAAFACLAGSGAEKAFGKLRDALGIESFDATATFIDPKGKPADVVDEKVDQFVASLG